jgi:hypothetical protein
MLAQSEISALSAASQRAQAFVSRLEASDTSSGWLPIHLPSTYELQAVIQRAKWDLQTADSTRDAAIEGGDHELVLKAIEQYNTIAAGGEVPFNTPLRDAIDGIKDALPSFPNISLPSPDLTWLKVTVVVIGLVALAYISRLIPRRAT